MSNRDGSTSPPPRRTRVQGERNHNLYQRPDGRYEVGWRDGSQKWRTLPPDTTLTHARGIRDGILAARARGEPVRWNPRLKFGEAADRWLAEQVADLKPQTRATYRSAVEVHLRPRWGRTRLDAITTDDAARLVRDLRALGLSEWTITGALKAANRVFRFARRRMGWAGESPVAGLEAGERARPSQAPRRRVFTREELAATIGAATGQWRVLFAFLATTGCRLSEALGLVWSDLDLSDASEASASFEHQADRRGERVALKTRESRRTVELPPSLAAMLMEHRAASPRSRDNQFVFATSTGRALGQRNCLRALRAAQKRARTGDGRWAFPVLHDDGAVPKGAVPNLHSFRHSAVSEAVSAGESVEEISWQLGHKNSVVTRTVYLQQIRDAERQARRRAAMEERYGAILAASPSEPGDGEVVSMRDARGEAA
jgi:integrase